MQVINSKPFKDFTFFTLIKINWTHFIVKYVVCNLKILKRWSYFKYDVLSYVLKYCGVQFQLMGETLSRVQQWVGQSNFYFCYIWATSKITKEQSINLKYGLYFRSFKITPRIFQWSICTCISGDGVINPGSQRGRITLIYLYLERIMNQTSSSFSTCFV